jgi:hypothetical protein
LRFLGGEDGGFHEGGVFDVFDGLALILAIPIQQFIGLDLENLNAQAELLDRGSHLLVGVVLPVVALHITINYQR